MNTNRDWNYWYILAAGMFFFLPFLGVVHLFDWDEINFAESAREMIVTGDYFRVMIDYEPFWEKPPFFFWLQAASMHVFGINEYAARFPNAIFGIITLLTIYEIGKREKSKSFGLLWTIIFGGALLPFFYFKSGIIDPVFNYFIFLSIYFLYRADMPSDRGIGFSTMAGIANGLAVLTKGPVGFLLLLLTYLVILSKRGFRNLPNWKKVSSFALSIIAVSFLWYGFELMNNGLWFFVEFIEYQVDLFLNPVAGHEQPFFYHFVVVFIGCFPFSIYALPGFTSKIGKLSPFQFWSKSLFWVVLILFSLATTKIVHYSSMAYLPLSFIAAASIHHYQREGKLPRGLVITFIVIGVIVSLLLTALPLAMIFKDQLKDYIADPFVQDSLTVNIPLLGIEWAIGIFYFVIIIIALRYRNKSLTTFVSITSLGTALFLWIIMSVMVPKVELFSQGPEIAFFKELQGQDVYVENVGFKSYAPYFYFKQPNYANDKARDRDWLMTGEIDKPVYFVTKSHREYFKEHPEIKLVEQRGGYRLYKRDYQKTLNRE